MDLTEIIKIWTHWDSNEFTLRIVELKLKGGNAKNSKKYQYFYRRTQVKIDREKEQRKIHEEGNK